MAAEVEIRCFTVRDQEGRNRRFRPEIDFRKPELEVGLDNRPEAVEETEGDQKVHVLGSFNPF